MQTFCWWLRQPHKAWTNESRFVSDAKQTKELENSYTLTYSLTQSDEKWIEPSWLPDDCMLTSSCFRFICLIFVKKFGWRGNLFTILWQPKWIHWILWNHHGYLPSYKSHRTFDANRLFMFLWKRIKQFSSARATLLKNR